MTILAISERIVPWIARVPLFWSLGLTMISCSEISKLIDSMRSCSNSPLGPLTLTTLLSVVTLTPDGIGIGKFPILLILNLLPNAAK